MSSPAIAEALGETRMELESLARAYLRLAEQVDRNGETDIVYLTPTPTKIPARPETISCGTEQ